jgi:hypothetical protein
MARRLEPLTYRSIDYDPEIKKVIKETLKWYLMSLNITNQGVGDSEIIPGNYVYDKNSCFSMEYFRNYLRRKENILLESADDLETVMRMAMELMFGPNKIWSFQIIPEKMDSDTSFVILRVSKD